MLNRSDAQKSQMLQETLICPRVKVPHSNNDSPSDQEATTCTGPQTAQTAQAICEKCVSLRAPGKFLSQRRFMLESLLTMRGQQRVRTRVLWNGVT